ncbi:MAG: replication initiation protein [Thiolinea sp.]
MSKSKVVVSNGLISAVQKLTLTEKRMLMLAVTKIDEGLGIEQAITINAAEFSKVYGLKKDAVYKSLKRAEVRLWNRELVMMDMTPPMVLRWIISRAYVAGEGEVHLRFHPDLDGHVINLKSHFTQYLLSRAAEFKHLCSWRMFEKIMQFRKTGVWSISVEEFKQIMEVPKAYDKDFGIVRRKIINLAIKEIKEKDGLEINCEVSKRGRKITGLKFTFPPEQQAALPLQQPKRQSVGNKRITKAYIEQHARPGETYEQARIRLQEEQRKYKEVA